MDTKTTQAYLEALRDHVSAHGRPLAFYADRHGIFRVNAKDAESDDGLTVFNRVTGRLRIEQICATTPQAMGRVERANQTGCCQKPNANTLHEQDNDAILVGTTISTVHSES